MYIIHVSATHVIHMYRNTCNTHKHHTCITGVAQLAMYSRTLSKYVWCSGVIYSAKLRS